MNKANKMLTLWHKARLNTTSRTRDDISLRPLVASCAPVDRDPCLSWSVPGITQKPGITITRYTYHVPLRPQMLRQVDGQLHPSSQSHMTLSPCAVSSSPFLSDALSCIISLTKFSRVWRRLRRTILRQCPCLITQQILDPPKFFGERTSPHDRIWDLGVVHDLLRVDCFSHV